jgi:hypothetical protein
MEGALPGLLSGRQPRIDVLVAEALAGGMVVANLDHEFRLDLRAGHGVFPGVALAAQQTKNGGVFR